MTQRDRNETIYMNIPVFAKRSTWRISKNTGERGKGERDTFETREHITDF